MLRWRSKARAQVGYWLNGVQLKRLKRTQHLRSKRSKSSNVVTSTFAWNKFLFWSFQEFPTPCAKVFYFGSSASNKAFRSKKSTSISSTHGNFSIFGGEQTVPANSNVIHVEITFNGGHSRKVNRKTRKGVDIKQDLPPQQDQKM